jgi:hypothetical protein
MSPLKLHQFRSMLDCAIDDSIGLGVKIFRKELGEKSGRDWSKFGRLLISENPWIRDDEREHTLRMTGHPAAIAPTKGERLRFQG